VVDVLAALVYVAALYPAGLRLYAALGDRESRLVDTIDDSRGGIDEAGSTITTYR